MQYKLISPLKTRHVEPFADYLQTNGVMEKQILVANAIIVRKAAEYGWFDGDRPDVDELTPTETLEIGTVVMQAYARAMGFDEKNSSARRQNTPKA